MKRPGDAEHAVGVRGQIEDLETEEFGYRGASVNLKRTLFYSFIFGRISY